MFAGKHEYRVVDASVDFPGVDHVSYEALEQLLRQEGFVLLGDIEDVTVTRKYPLMRTFIRKMVSADGTITASLYDLAMIGPL